MLRTLEFCGVLSSKAATSTTSHTTTVVAQRVVTDLTVCIFSPTFPPSTCKLDPRIWHRVEKDLFLYTSQQCAWLYVALANEEELIAEVDVLFGVDAVDPRPQWTLMRSPLQLNAHPKIPVARLSVHRGRAKPRPDARAALRVRGDGKFKIVQISDTHMVTGVGSCKDAVDAHGNHLPESEADPLTVQFIGKVLDVEKADLVILAGDQLHHDIPDSQSALFKVVAPIIERSIPFAAVFGNHDSEGIHALPRE